MRKLFAVAVSATLVGFVACSSSTRSAGDRDGGVGPEAGVFGSDAVADSPFTGCARGTYAAKVTPAAMLFVLDKSGTMAQGGKFASAQQAIVTAADEPTFDSMVVGLLGYPTLSVTGPACIFGLPVLCGVTGLPQVPLRLAGASKSNGGPGVRRDMYAWLSSNAPQPGFGDGNPTYEALKSGINALKVYNLNKGKRILVYITAGGASCASVSSPSRPGYTDGNSCPDWEHPQSIVDLLKAAHDDAEKPVNSMIVGVPGADTHGENTNVPPYSVRLALSAYAATGSPETIDPTCDGKAFTKVNTDPGKACHFDMTRNFSPEILAGAIGQVRGKLLGCVFDLPEVDGKIVDRDKVNVDYTIKDAPIHIYKRKSPSDTCAADGCWDYTADGRVELLGKACEDVKTSTSAKVEIVVGCQTIVK